MPSPFPLSYRNKIQLPIGPALTGLKAGMYARSSHDLVEVDHCLVHCEQGEEVYRKIREILSISNITPYNFETGEGELRYLLIKTAIHTKEVLVILVVANGDREKYFPLSEKIMSACPAVKGVLLNRNSDPGNVVLSDHYELLQGNRQIEERLLGLRFKISPASFFQVNTHQAEQLYERAIGLAKISSQDTVLDAFCGIGTLTLLAARHCKQAIGVECVEQAICDANQNRVINQINNASFFCDQAEKFIENLSSCDVVLLNPPRKGCEKSFLDAMSRLKPKKIVYISCEPSTLARDLNVLSEQGYRVTAVSPFDMFPQTAHVETIAALDISI